MGLQSNNLRYYRNCNEIPVWNFNEIIKSGDFNWLVYGYDGFNKYDNINSEECSLIWEEIKNEFFILSDNQSSIRIIFLEAEIDYLTRRFDIVYALLHTLISKRVQGEQIDQFIDHLNRWMYYVNKSKPLKEELIRLTKQHQASKITIARKKNELEKLIEDSAKGDVNIVREKIKLQRVLSMQIDLKTTTMAEWLEMFKVAAEIIKDSERGKRNKGSQ